MTSGSIGFGVEGKKAIVKHFPCAPLAAVLYVFSSTKLRIRYGHFEFSLRKNPPRDKFATYSRFQRVH
jgi:hypothetical protein